MVGVKWVCTRHGQVNSLPILLMGEGHCASTESLSKLCDIRYCTDALLCHTTKKNFKQHAKKHSLGPLYNPSFILIPPHVGSNSSPSYCYCLLRILMTITMMNRGSPNGGIESGSHPTSVSKVREEE